MRREKFTRFSRIALLPAIAATLAFAAPAQAAGPKSESTQAQASDLSQASIMARRDLRASEVIGMSVRNDQGKNIGQIGDMIVDLKTGAVRYAVLRFDPGIFSGERLFAVPTNQLRMAPDRNDVVYPMREDRLEQAAIAKKDWNSKYLGDGKQVARLNQGWGIKQPAADARSYRASDLIGKKVVHPNGAPIGSVEELVVDMAGQQVHYAVVNFDHGWAGSDKRVAFPMHSLQLGRGDKDDVVLDIDRAKLASTQGFEKGDYKRLNERELMTRIDRHLSFFPAHGGVKSSSGAGAAGSAATAQTDLRTQPLDAKAESRATR